MITPSVAINRLSGAYLGTRLRSGSMLEISFEYHDLYIKMNYFVPCLAIQIHFHKTNPYYTFPKKPTSDTSWFISYSPY